MSGHKISKSITLSPLIYKELMEVYENLEDKCSFSSFMEYIIMLGIFEFKRRKEKMKNENSKM